MTVPSGLFEDEKNERGKLVLSEHGLAMIEAVDNRIANRHDELVETVDAYMELVNENAEDSISELRKLMILAVSELGGAPARDAFLAKIAALARSGVLSASSGAWAQGSRNDAAGNHGSLTPNSRPARYEEVEPLTEGYVRAISRTARKG